MNVFIDLSRHFQNAPGTGVMETTKEEFFQPAFEAALPGYPVRVFRDKELTDLFAVVWADGGVDYHR